LIKTIIPDFRIGTPKSPEIASKIIIFSGYQIVFYIFPKLNMSGTFAAPDIISN
jgi:hypothetical protein